MNYKKHRIKVWGDFACFTRPEMKVERVSYSLITPSAARAIFEAILWTPQIRWHIKSIRILNPIKWINIQRNEVSSKLLRGKELFIEDERVQRSSLCLKNVAYEIHAEIESLSETPNLKSKFDAIFERRARRGACFSQPYLGCREFPAYFELLKKKHCPAIDENRDFGLMLLDMSYGREEITPRFFHAVMKNGEVSVPYFNRTVESNS